jgi:O-antigen/teichoic acid export membrane protein
LPSLSQSTARAVLRNVVLIPLLGVLSLVSSALVARTLSLEEYRVYGLAVAAVASLLLWSDLGISSAVARFTPELRKRSREATLRFLETAARTRFVALGVLLTGLLLARSFGPVGPRGEEIVPFQGWSLWLIVITVAAQGAARVLQYFLSGLFQRGRVGAILVLAALAQSTLVILAAVLATGVVGILGALALAAVFELALSRFWVFREASRWPETDETGGDERRGLKRDAARYAGASFVEKVASYLNGPSFVIFLIAAAGSPEVAYFAVASEFAMRVVAFLSVPLSGVTLPHFSAVDAPEDPGPVGSLLRIYLMLLFLLFVPTAAFLASAADVVVTLVYGVRYAAAVPILRWYVPFLFLEYTVYSALLAALMTRGHYRQVLLAKLPLLAGVPAVVLVIPLWGAKGAVIAFGIARLLSAVLLLRTGLDVLAFRFPGVYAAKVLAASLASAAAMAAVRPLAGSSWPALFTLALAGGLAFFAVYKLLGGMAPVEKDQMLAGIPPRLAWIRSLL